VASDFASALLVKTLRSTTFKLALISIGVFGAVVIVLFGYVYWSTTNFVLSRADNAIAPERATLRNIYDTNGREGLIQAIGRRGSTASAEGGVYLLADQSFSPVAGDLKKWPVVKSAGQWTEFKSGALNQKTDTPLYRATWETLPDGFHLLVGKDISDLTVLIVIFCSTQYQISSIMPSNTDAGW
jgi:hypothetical protein